MPDDPGEAAGGREKGKEGRGERGEGMRRREGEEGRKVEMKERGR